MTLAKRRTDAELQERAIIIATSLAGVHTDQRGTLLRLVGENLRNQGQGYTGNLMIKAGKEYGE